MLKIGTFNGSGTKVRLEAFAMLEAAVAVFNSNKTQIFGGGNNVCLVRFGRVQAGAGSYKAIQYKGRLEVDVPITTRDSINGILFMKQQ
jgi:hypothetical protein